MGVSCHYSYYIAKNEVLQQKIKILTYKSRISVIGEGTGEVQSPLHVQTEVVTALVHVGNQGKSRLAPQSGVEKHNHRDKHRWVRG